MSELQSFFEPSDQSQTRDDPALLADVRAAGSFKRYANAPRLDVVVLQAMCVKGRASPPPALARLFPTSTKSPHLPREIFWRILQFWRTDRDP